MSSFVSKFVRLGHHKDDPQEVRLKKSSLLVVSAPFSFAGLLWGLIYFTNGLLIPGAIPFTYGLLSIINIIAFSFNKRYKFFRNSQLVLILLLPFALQLSLGGFVQSSAVIYWAIIAPAGAMFFDSVRRSLYWFTAYLILVIIAYMIDDLIPNYVNYDLSDVFINNLFLMNIIGVSCIVFGILFYFVNTITQLNKDIETKNDALKEQSEQLLQLDKAKSRFFANISHEFRTPLTLILNLAKKQKSRPDSPPDPTDCEVMERNAERLLHLINQLLDLSKLESGNIKLSLVRRDIVTFARSIVALFESMAKLKHIHLTFNGHELNDISEVEQINTPFDEEKVQKVLSNLMSNAIKFTPENGRIEVEVERKSSESGQHAVSLAVINTGDPIPEEKLPLIFNRFYQVDDAANRKFEGSGIGLALVKELAELHRGSVSVTSKMNKTTFIVQLPAGEDEYEGIPISINEAGQTESEDLIYVEEVASETEAPDTGDSDEEKLHLLLVEDNADLRKLIREMFAGEYRVTEAVDGEKGLEKALDEIPDLIVSDVMMPNMDGFELCQRLKTNTKTDHVPIILLTAKADREHKIEGLDTGADDYLVKPFDEQELKARIRNLIESRKKLQARFSGEIKLRPKQIEAPSVHQKFIDNIKQVIEENIDNESFSPSDMEKAIGMSRSQIHRKLKALTNKSLTEFIKTYRLHRAADLLKQEAGNVTEIAFEVGFSSQTYFSSSFKGLFGMSPTEYKKQHQKKDITD